MREQHKVGKAASHRRARVTQATLWPVVVLGFLYAANDGPIPAVFYVLCVGVVYFSVVVVRRLVRHTRRSTSGP
jgi:hypothetical protein